MSIPQTIGLPKLCTICNALCNALHQTVNLWSILQYNCILMMYSFRSAKVAVIAIANIWFVVWFGFSRLWHELTFGCVWIRIVTRVGICFALVQMIDTTSICKWDMSEDGITSSARVDSILVDFSLTDYIARSVDLKVLSYRIWFRHMV